MMTCQECLVRYSEFADMEDAADAASWRSHLERCPSCARYHRVVQRGLRLVREIPDVGPSSEFHPRLQYRIFQALDERDRHQRFATTGAASSLAVAAAIALVAWGPLLLEMRAREALAGRETVQVTRELSETRDARVSRTAGFAGPVSLVANAVPTLGFALPGPYSPLIVAPPVTGATDRTARNVFTAYFPGPE